MTTKILILFLLTISFSLCSQIKEQTKLTYYYYVGEGCPLCNSDHPEKKLGFFIKCAGCIKTDTTDKHNKYVVQQLDKKYGQGWTANYLKNYCGNVSIDIGDKKVKSK